MPTQTLYAGCDPGYAKMGFSFVDTANDKALMMNVDLRKWGGRVHKLEFQDLGPCVYEFCESQRKFFEKTESLNIELLPKAIKIGRKIQPTNPMVRDMMVMLAQTVHIMFPHIRVYFVDSRVRTTFAGTGGGKNREENKKITFDRGIIMPRGNLEMAKEMFRDKDGIHADPVEATECAMMIKDHTSKLITSNYHKLGVCRNFDTVKYASPVIYPPIKNKKRTKTDGVAMRKKQKKA